MNQIDLNDDIEQPNYNYPEQNPQSNMNSEFNTQPAPNNAQNLQFNRVEDIPPPINAQDLQVNPNDDVLVQPIILNPEEQNLNSNLQPNIGEENFSQASRLTPIVQQQPIIRQVTIQDPSPNRENYFKKFNSFLRKKNFTVVYFAFLEILFMILQTNAYINNENWNLQLLPPTIDVAVNFLYICYFAKEQRHCCSDKLCFNWFTNLCKVPMAIFSWKAANSIRDGSDETFIYLIPMACFIVMINMCNMDEEYVDGRGGPMYFYENFDYTLYYSQGVLISVVLSYVAESFDWQSILIPIFILACIKSLKVFVILCNWFCMICEIDKLCSQPTYRKKELQNLLNFADSMPFPFVLPWFFYGPYYLNWIYDNDMRVNYYAQNKNDMCKQMIVCMLVSIFFKWIVLFCLSPKLGDIPVVAQIQAPAQQQNVNASGLRQSSLAPPRQNQAHANNEGSWKDRVLSFLPKSGNYYVKNPTPAEIEAFKLKSKSFTQEEKLCKICYCVDSNTQINACGHSCMCKDCARDVAKKMGTCPLCRTKIDRILVIEKISDGQVKVLEEIK